MTANGWLQISVFMAALLALSWPLGLYMARVYANKPCGLDRLLGPLERLLYQISGVKAGDEMDWRRYAAAMLLFNGAGFCVVYALARLQATLPLNPDGMAAVPPHLAFNAAMSFATNTNWQSYGGETTLSYLTQMLGLGVQNFVSAATGMATLAAFIRGFARASASTIGNFWVDLTRSTLYILLPLSILLAVALVSQGVVQTFEPAAGAALLEPMAGADGATIASQKIARGPVASQVAIKQLGTNGGGFFNANSSHPLENPTPVSNFLEMFAILIISAGLCHTFGEMARDHRQGWAVLAAMTILFALFLAPAIWAEHQANPKLAGLPLHTAAQAGQSGGNMEGKEVRFGIVNSALWATATTAASNGSVNSMHDSYTPLGGMIPMILMQLGEVIYGGVGSGLYGMLVFAIIAVFIAGLMVGRTPEYLGKKIEPFEMKMASIVILIPPMVVLAGTAAAVSVKAGPAGILNPGAHGFSEILYAFSSAGNNNGSAFAGLTANSLFYNTALGLAMFFSRYWLALPALAIAGSLAGKKIVPPSSGTLPTHTPLFVILLVSVVLIMGALTFIPSLALGPIVEHLQMIK